MGTQKKRLADTVSFEHPKHMFKKMDKKIIAILLEHPKHMFKKMDQKIIAILRLNVLLNWRLGVQVNSLHGGYFHDLFVPCFNFQCQTVWIQIKPNIVVGKELIIIHNLRCASAKP